MKNWRGMPVNLLKGKFLLQAMEHLFTPKFSCQCANSCLLLEGKGPLAVQTSCMVQPHFNDLRRPNMSWSVYVKKKKLFSPGRGVRQPHPCQASTRASLSRDERPLSCRRDFPITDTTFYHAPICGFIFIFLYFMFCNWTGLRSLADH